MIQEITGRRLKGNGHVEVDVAGDKAVLRPLAQDQFAEVLNQVFRNLVQIAAALETSKSSISLYQHFIHSFIS